MCDDIMRRVAGCSLSHTRPMLPSLRRYAVRGEVYPALVASEGGLVEGVVYHDIPEAAWLRLDRFEGEMYERRLVYVSLTDGRTETVHTYIIKPEFELEARFDRIEFRRSSGAERPDLQMSATDTAH